MACRKAFYNLRYEGPMTPPSIRGTLHYPGPAGGMNWGSVAVDEERQLMVVNNLHLAWTIHMIPREDVVKGMRAGASAGFGIGGPQRGPPFAARVGMFASPVGLPCLKPPYGEIAVVDLTSQEILWRRGVGPLNLGLPHTAGSFVTASGLIFNAGVIDRQLRAMDTLTGDVVWQDELRSASDATPMSYVSPTTGRQYVLVTVPGNQKLGGSVIAYALAE